MNETDKKKMLKSVKIAYSMTGDLDTSLIRAALAARAFRTERELYQNGDKVQVRQGFDNWRDADYVGKTPHGISSHVVLLDGVFQHRICKDIRTPLVKERRYLSISALAKVLEDGGWQPDGVGNFVHKEHSNFRNNMWCFCGEKVPAHHTAHDSWTEFVEVQLENKDDRVGYPHGMFTAMPSYRGMTGRPFLDDAFASVMMRRVLV